MATVLYLTWHRSRSSFGLPVILVAGILLAHLVFWLAGISLAEAQAAGWTFQPPPHVTYMVPWSATEIGRYPWHLLPDLSGNLIAVVFVTASSALFNTTGLEVAIHREANLERELSVTGLANMLSGAFGGYTGCVSISRSVLNFNSGGRGRLSGLTVAAISVLMLAFAPMLLGYMPKFVLGGLLIYLGADQLHKWIIQSRRRLSLTEYLSLLAIIVIIVQWGFIAGILIGVVIGCATFALSASRIDSIKYSFDGSEFRSSLDRSRDDQAVLSVHGGKIQGLNLQSYLFFGSANRLYQHVKALLARHPECRFLVFDFKLVTGINSSAAYSFAQIKRAAHDRGIRLVLVHLPPAAEKALRSSEFISQEISIVPELDHALEWCENEIIAQHQDREGEEASLRDWFTEILGTETRRPGTDPALPAPRGRRRRDHRQRRRRRQFHAFHSRRPRRHHDPGRRRPHHAGAQPRPLYHHRRDGPGLAGAAQRHHPGRGRQRALRPEHASIRGDQERESRRSARSC